MSDPLTHPARGGFPITPHDTNDLTIRPRGIYAGVSGDVVAVMDTGEELTFVGLVAGVVHPLRVRRIKLTGTTATNIVGVY